jgi:hypothetical protein
MPRTTILILLVAAMMASGCVALTAHPKRSFDPKADIETLQSATDLALVWNDYRIADDKGKKEIRNDFINGRIYVIDQNFEDYQHDLAREGVILDIGADWSQIALSLASGVVPLNATKTVLSTVSGGIGSAKASMDKNLFYKKTMEVLLVKMKANRAELLTQIQQKMTQATDLYPLTAALLDLEAYYRAGTLTQALVGILENAGKAIDESKKTSAGLVTGNFSPDENTSLLSAALKKEGFKDELKKWMKDNNLGEVSITTFLNSKEYAKKREEAVKKFKL